VHESCRPSSEPSMEVNYLRPLFFNGMRLRVWIPVHDTASSKQPSASSHPLRSCHTLSVRKGVHLYKEITLFEGSDPHSLRKYRLIESVPFACYTLCFWKVFVPHLAVQRLWSLTVSEESLKAYYFPILRKIWTSILNKNSLYEN